MKMALYDLDYDAHESGRPINQSSAINEALTPDHRKNGGGLSKKGRGGRRTISMHLFTSPNSLELRTRQSSKDPVIRN
jgi:hypothetical protein